MSQHIYGSMHRGKLALLNATTRGGVSRPIRGACLLLILFCPLTAQAETQLTALLSRWPSLGPTVLVQRVGDIATLKLGEALERELKAGESHTYQVRLAAGDYLHALVEQKGIDVVVTLFAPDGGKLLEVDSPNGVQGPEPVLSVAETSGLYQLQVRSLEADAAPGRYDVRLEELRPATPEDKNRIVSLRKAAEARLLESQVVGEVMPLLVKGEELRGEARYKEAEPLVEQALSIAEKKLGPENKVVAICLNSLGLIYNEGGYYERAEPLLLRALPMMVKEFGPEHQRVAILMTNLGTLYYAKGDYVRAESFLRRSTEMAEKVFLPSAPELLTFLNNLAELYNDEGKYEIAEPIYKRALDLGLKALGPKHRYVINLLRNLGVFYSNVGDFRQANELLQRSLTLGEEVLGKEHPEVAISLNNLGHIYFQDHNYPIAKAYFQRALAIFEKTLRPGDPTFATLYLNAGDMERFNGNEKGAEQYYLRSLDVGEKALGPEHPDMGKTLNNLASLYDDTGEYEKAERAYRRALLILEKAKGPKHLDVSMALSNLATNSQARGDIAQAVKYAGLAHDIREYNFTHTLTIGSEQQKRLFLSKYYPETEGAISLHLTSAPNDLQAARVALTSILRRKGRVLDVMVDQMTALRRDASPEVRALSDQLRDARTRLATLTMRGPGKMGQSQYRAAVAGLEVETQRLEAELSGRNPAYRFKSEPVSIEQVQRSIPRSAAVVEFIQYRPFNARAKLSESYGNERYAAYVLRHEGDPRWVDLGDAAPINDDVRTLRTGLRRPETRIEQAAQALEAKVMRPVRKLLGETRTVFLSPDSALNLIPFGALMDERGRFLVEDYSFTYLTSARDLLRLETRLPSRQPPVVIANPQFSRRGTTQRDTASRQAPDGAGRRSRDFNGQFNSLAGTGVEAREVGEILGVKPLTWEQATEAAVKRLHAPAILHLATHGFFLPNQRKDGVAPSQAGNAPLFDLSGVTWNENPLLRSGLALAGANELRGGDEEDGILTALEASGLDLWGTKLVVLSACETGLGDVQDGEGVYGLRRAIVLAGAESQVISLWKVDDEVTRDLMARYYKRLKAGEGRSEALRNVQVNGLKSKSQGHPYFWASFIESGDWRSLNGR